MSLRATPRIFSIPPGIPFLPCLVDALFSGGLIPDFKLGSDPLALASATIYLPTRRAVRELRSTLVDHIGKASAILPSIRALGEFAEEELLFVESGAAEALEMAPPIGALDRLLLLAPLVQAWKGRLPAHLAARYEEHVVVPASAADAIWFARDLAALIDEMETESADWGGLAGLVEGDLAAWWQVTLEFLQIVSAHWPERLRELGRSNPVEYRNVLLAAEGARLLRNPPDGPVIAAGSTGSIPATAALLSVISRLPKGAVILPGLDTVLDEASWEALGDPSSPAICGHPQYGLKKLLDALKINRGDVIELSEPPPHLAARRRLLSDALRPAETTDRWGENPLDTATDEALSRVSLIEAANGRDEALAIAVALKHAIDDGSKTAALVTPDRELARRASAELQRFQVTADDSGGTPLSRTPAATLLRLALECAFRPGDPVTLLALLKHPILTLGMERSKVRSAAETIDLVALRGDAGRPDVATLAEEFPARLSALEEKKHPPFWKARLTGERTREAGEVVRALADAIAPLLAWRTRKVARLSDITRASVEALERLGRSGDGTLQALYRGNSGEKLAAFLAALVGSATALEFSAADWPDMLDALIATEVVKPAPGSEHRIAIWGALEARLQSVDTLVIGGLNEGTWPRQPEADRFMSRFMKTGIDLEPPERRIGLAAHDFMMAMGNGTVILSRSARSGDAPATPSRWLQRILTCADLSAVEAMRQRGTTLLAWAHAFDEGKDIPFAPRPQPAPPLEARPKKLSITEIETLRRDPYTVYARRILGLEALDPLLRDPGAMERGTLFHEALERFTKAVDPQQMEALEKLLAIGRTLFEEAALPSDVATVWWPRFERMAHHLVKWERSEAAPVRHRHAEIMASPIRTELSPTAVSGRADRVDVLADGTAIVYDYKTGASPSKGQAHTLLSPQLALEGALLKRGAFASIGAHAVSDLVFVRLKGNGDVIPESILQHARSIKTADALCEEAWQRLGELFAHYDDPANGYLSRAIPFREGDVSGDYDHLARVQEWSAGSDDEGTDA
ncbi:MAG: double-strand break repair protein AddB [Rhizobiaceae bacterium]|nr:MAG: double-strand break repair protein AddB [Rhizobiaceae bacterium]